MTDFIGDTECGPTHHLACDCREEMFVNMEIELAKASAILSKLAMLRKDPEGIDSLIINEVADFLEGKDK